MNYRFFGENIDPNCGNCHYGSPSSNKEQILCKKKGVAHSGFLCKSYQYNPLRRIPDDYNAASLFMEKSYDEIDFKL